MVDADLKSYFDTIPKDRLLALVTGKMSDRRVLALVGAFLDQRVLEGALEWTSEQGAAISLLLSNNYLDPLDHLMARGGFEMLRYADDFVVLCRIRRKLPKAWPWCRAGRRKPDWPCTR